MLTNLDFLRSGKPWPPRGEFRRLQGYADNEKLFLTQHDQVWGARFKLLGALYRKRNSSVSTIINYHQLLSRKTADFICGEPPTIETEEDTDALTEVLEREQFATKLYEAMIDVSRFGDALVKFHDRHISVVSPQFWFPVVDPDNLKHITHHVIAYPNQPDEYGKMTQLYVEIHSPGYVEIARYAYQADTKSIGERLTQPDKPIKTLFEGFAIKHLTNVTHSTAVHGIDDYSIINSIVERIMWRLHCAGGVLDKHSEPSMTGPSSALEQDPRTGLWFVPLGNYFAQDDVRSPKPGYMTWDGNLEANWQEIELLFRQLYILTEMGQAFAEGGGGGEASSGTALKLRMVSPRIKAKRIANLNASTVKEIISGLAALNGITLQPGWLLKWNDGLPNDEVEETQMLVTATGGRPVMSQYAAMKQRGLSDKQVEAELEQIRIEDASRGPSVLSVFDSHRQEVNDGTNDIGTPSENLSNFA